MSIEIQMTNQKTRPGQAQMTKSKGQIKAKAQMTKRNEEVFSFTCPARRTTLAGGSASFQGQNCATLKGRTTEIATPKRRNPGQKSKIKMTGQKGKIGQTQMSKSK